MSVHFYGDETKENGFVLAAAVVQPCEVDDLRALMRTLKLPRQVRIHFTSESDPRRTMIIGRLAQAKVQAVIYDARAITDPKRARQAAVARLADDAAKMGAARIVLEPDGPAVDLDKLTIRDRLVRAGCLETVSYVHLQAREECLLSIPDAVAWCFGKGGSWYRAAQQLIVEEVEL